MKNAKYPPQTPEEMKQELNTKRQSSKLYKVQADAYKAGELSQLINQTVAALKESEHKGRISLSDFDAVKKQTFEYLQACEMTGTFPSMSGLARSMGYSRRAIYDEIDRRSTQVSDWLERTRDLFSDILAQASLQNNANSIVSIFLQKALYGMRETVELTLTPPNPLGENADAGQVKKLIDALPAADYELPEE